MPHETIESHAIDLLTSGSMSTVDIIKNIQKNQPVTKEAVYKALRHLLEKEIVVKKGKTISLSNQWVIDMAEKWREAEIKYVGRPKPYLPAEKNSIIYTCKTIDQLDTLWNHNIYELVSTLPRGSHLLSSVPHYWFPSIRSGSELRLMHTLATRGYRWHQMASNATKLDIDLRKYFPHEELEYFAANIPEKNYINIFGDYVLEVTLDRKASEYIERWYETYSVFDTGSIAELEKVLKIKGVYKLKISKNKTKAEKWRKTFKKYFVMK